MIELVTTTLPGVLSVQPRVLRDSRGYFYESYVLPRFREAGSRYGMDAGEMTVCKLIEEDAGIDLRVRGDWVAPWEVSRD